MLIVLDGWGLAEPGPGNAISLARTPVFDELWQAYPHGRLTACGRAVGLPEGQMGNSEVGHLNLGAGAVVRQDLMRIDDAIADGEMGRNEVLRAAFSDARRVHLLGLVSDGGVHSSLEHLRALIGLGRELGAADVVVHAFTDGRDTLPHAGAGFLAELDEIEGARVGSVVGRYWAMDRDRRWERTARAYELIVGGRAQHRAESGEQAVLDAYGRGETDEFIEPTLVGAEARIGSGDSVLVLQLPARPNASAGAGARRARLRRGAFRGAPGLAGARRRAAGRAPHQPDPLRGGLALPGGLRPRTPCEHPLGGARRCGRVAAARGRDREVPARHVLLQRRRRGAASRGSAARWCPRHATFRPTTTSRR